MIQNADFVPIKLWLNENIHFMDQKRQPRRLLNDLDIVYDPQSFLSSFSN